MRMSGSYVTATVVEEHKVAAGESLESIASEHGLSWQELAEFNCGSSEAKQVNRYLREVVGMHQAHARWEELCLRRLR